MLIFPGQIAEAASEAGMRIPDNPDEPFNAEEYPHFKVLCESQLCRPMFDPNEPWINARIIAAIPDNRIRLVNIRDLRDLGVRGIE